MQHEIGTMADSKVFFVFLLLSMDLSIVALNMHGFTSGKHYLRKLALEYDIIAYRNIGYSQIKLINLKNGFQKVTTAW